MMDVLKSLFGGKSRAANEDELSPHVAATALLVEAALADGIYAHMEAERIKQILKEAFDLEEAEAEAVLNEGEDLAEEAVDHYRFTKIVKENLPLEKREKLVEHLWSVVFADGERAAEEDSFIRRVAPLLAVEDRARVLARKRAEDEADA